MVFHIYKDKEGKWRWRATSGTRILADSGQGYKAKTGNGSVTSAIKTFKLKCLRAEVVEEETSAYPKKAAKKAAKKVKKSSSTKGK